MPTLVEVALEAWSECRPEGMQLPVERLSMLLPGISLRVPGGTESPDKAQKLNHVFKAQGANGDEPSVFQSWLRPRDGFIHFLYFWRAFIDAAHLVAGPQGPEQEESVEEALAGELDAFRDSILSLDEPPNTTSQIPAAGLIGAVNASAAASRFPRFWILPVETATCLVGASNMFSLPELAMIILPWIQEAASWEQRDLEEQLQHDLRQREREEGLIVNVHIYDVSQEEKIQKLNRVLAHQYSPLKLGGVFHAAIEVLGLEWSYGCSDDETRPGVSCCKAKQHPMHNYRQTVVLGKCKLPEGEIGLIISSMLEEYPGDDYNILRRNCCHFADDFARRLQVGGLPGWVCRLARVGAGVENALQRAQGIPGFDAAVEKVLEAVLPAEDDTP